MKQKILLFITLFCMLTFFSAFLPAQMPASDEDEDLSTYSEELEEARQDNLDQDLEELEQMQREEELATTHDLEEIEKSQSQKEEPQKEPAPIQEPETPLAPTEEKAEPVEEISQQEEAIIKQAPSQEIEEVPPTLEPPAQPEPQEKEPAPESGRLTLEPQPTKESPQYWGLTLMGGPHRPDKYVGKGDSFKNIYTGKDWFLDDKGLWTDLAFEWQFFKLFGKLGLKMSTGTWIIQDLHDATSDDTTEKKRYTLFAIPLFGGLTYRFHYWTKQPLIPFIEGGYGGFRFQQTQGASKDQYTEYKTAYLWGIGIQLNANMLDPEAGRDFDIDWGVNQTHFIAQLRHITSKPIDRFDFSTQNLITGGLLFEF